ncbi:MAG: Fe-S cluster assembly protein SufD [Planctomycetes bacterium]|nr:Fe-S cluster assembly protein SufD [Planctomycetota bacterium]
MVGLKDISDTYRSHLARVEKSDAGDAFRWLHPLREAAFARFCELGFPSVRDEEWRFTNTAPIANTAFAPAPSGEGVDADQVAPFTLREPGAHRIVFVNGRFVPALSAAGSLPGGVILGGLCDAAREHRLIVEAHLGQYATIENHAFSALNTAMLEDGAFVYVPKGTVVDAPIHLLFLSVADAAPWVAHPRNLIVTETSSQATIVETYAALDGGVQFTNAVTEIVAGENTVIDHYRVGCESTEAFHVGALHLHLRRSSTLTSHSIIFGGALVRNDIHANLAEEDCECTLNGLYMIEGTQHVDNHLVIDHAKPHCRSWEYFKGILDGKSRGVFSGRINVHENAQKTDAKQTNMSLLLSDHAQVQSKPQLEIFADDVKCTHGATIGQLDDEAVFYLRSRGIKREDARSLLTFAFAGENLNKIRVASLRAQLEQHVRIKLSP